MLKFGAIRSVFTVSDKQRRHLLWAYAAVFCVYFGVALCLDASLTWPPAYLVWCFGGESPGSPSLSSENVSLTLMFMGGFVALQTLFIWGGGRVTDQVVKRQWLRNFVSILIAASLIASNIFGILIDFSDWSDRFDSDRSTQYKSFFKFDQPWPILGVLFVAVLSYLFWRNSRLSRRAVLHNLIYPITLSTWLQFIISLPTQAVVSTHLKGGFLSFLTPSLFSVALSFPALLWCAGVWVYLKSPEAEAATSAASRTGPAVKGGPYIDSAKTIASLLLVIAYFGINQAVTYAANLEAAVEARAAFSADLVTNYLSSFDQFQKWRQSDGKSATDDQIYAWLEAHLPGAFSTGIPWVDAASVKVGYTHGSLFGGHSRPILIVEVQEYNSPRPWTSSASVNFSWIATPPIPGTPIAPADHQFEIAKAAVREGIEIRKEEDYATLYLRTENALLHKQVALPASGFSFPEGQVVWVCLVVAVAMLVILQDRIRNVFRDPDLGRGEPWLILDADGTLAGVLSQLWRLATFVGPCLLGILTVRVASLEIRSAGSVSYLVSDILTYLALLLLLTGASLLSIKVISDVAQLRRQQRRVDVSGNVFE